MKLEYKRLGIQLGSQCTGYVHEMHVWVERPAVLFWNEKGSAQPHREDIIAVWVYIDRQNILHVLILPEVEASALNCGHNVLDVRVAQVEGES